MKSLHPLFKKIITSVFVVNLLTFHVSQAQNYAVRNVTIITMEKETPLNNQTILIENGKISAIGSSIKLPSNVSLIDGTGKYMIPGLMDMHAHFFYEQGKNINTCEQELKLMLANGLTTVRIEGGHPAYLEARGKTQTKEWDGPKLLVVSVPLAGKVAGADNPFEQLCETPEQAEKAVRQAKANGYDAIKLTFMIKPDVYQAAVKTANEIGIKVTGHVGPLVKLDAALKARQQIEHMDEFIDTLLPDTTINHGQSVSDMNLWSSKAWETVPYLDESRIPALIERVKNSGIYVTPTNYFFYSFFGTGVDLEKSRQREDFQYVPAFLKDYAWKVKAKYWSKLPPEASRKKYIYLRERMIRDLWKAGVPLMAGSDSPQWFLVTGFAIHDELENLVQSGLTPYAALQTATINPAHYLEIEKTKGTITIGKDADLILLDKDPVKDIKNARAINSVFSRGMLYDRSKLNQLLSEAKVLAN